LHPRHDAGINGMKMGDSSLKKTVSDPYSNPYRWVMLGLLWLLYASFGINYRCLSPLITPILEDLNISYSQMGLVLGSWQLTYIVAAAFAGVLIDKWGARKALFLGTVIMALSVGMRNFSYGFATFLPLVALFGLGGPMISIGCPKTIAQWFFGKDRGTAVGIYLTGPWLGGAFALAATNSAVMPLTGQSWRLTFALYGLLALAVAFLWWFLAREIEVSGDSDNVGMKTVLVRLIRIRNIQIVLLSGLLTFGVIHGFTSWLPKIFESRGFSQTLSGYASSAPLLVGIPALLLLPRMIQPRKRAAAISVMALTVVVSVWAFFTFTGVLMFAGLILYGVTSSTLVPLLTLILMETPEVGSRYMGSAGGLFFCISEIGGFLSPLVVGMLVDWTGGFLAGGYFVMVLGLAVFMLTFLLQHRGPKAE
jgi:cyanate permease